MGGPQGWSMSELDAAIAALGRGDLVAFPTETVYGLGADATSEQALQRLYAAKGRPTDHPVIVHLGEQSWLSEWAEVDERVEMLVGAFWPGPLTLILPKKEHVLSQVTGGQRTVGVRMPAHPVALKLLKAFGRGLAAPSANRFGRISPTKADHVRSEFPDDDVLVLDGGDCQVGVESTILDLSSERLSILRPGGISRQALEEVLGVSLTDGAKTIVRAPGTLASHYAPTTPARLVARKELAEAVAEEKGRLGVLSITPIDAAVYKQMPNDPKLAAQTLYSSLRELDASEVDLIFVEAPPETEEWLAVRDRLSRACH